MISQKKLCNEHFQLYHLPANIIWYACDGKKVFFAFDEKVALVVATQASLERFTFFLLGLSDPDNLDDFSKDSYHMSKNVVSKNKVNYKLTLLVYKKKLSRNN